MFTYSIKISQINKNLNYIAEPYLTVNTFKIVKSKRFFFLLKDVFDVDRKGNTELLENDKSSDYGVADYKSPSTYPVDIITKRKNKLLK